MNAVPAWLVGASGAPSAHNTQPWQFRVLEDGRIAVRWNPGRALPDSDPTRRDLFLGLGAAVESACLRSAGAGVPLRFQAEVRVPECMAGYLVERTQSQSDDDRALLRALDSRHTARTPHLSQPVPVDIFDCLGAEAVRFGCGFYVVTDPHRIRQLSRLARRATAALYADARVHAELWSWLRLDPSDPAYRRDGLTAGCLELRGLPLAVARRTLPPHRMRQLVRVGLHRVLALETQLTVRRSASLCLLTAASERPEDLLAAGRTLLRLWLLVDGAGLSTHPVSALLDVAETAAPTVQLFGADGVTPANVFRLGFCPAVERSPRLPMGELLETER